MQSAPKKGGFKAPTFAVPIKSAEDTTDKKISSDKAPTKSETRFPSEAGDNNAYKDNPVLDTTQKKESKDLSTFKKPKVTKKGDNEKTNKKIKKQPKPKNNKEEEICSSVPLKIEEIQNESKENDTNTLKTVEQPEANADSQNLPEDAAEKKTHDKVKKKLYTEKKIVEAKEPKTVLPVRSLTDDEYEDIFSSAIQKAMDTNMEEWVPKISNPIKVKKSIKDKCCITVGKKDKKLEIEKKTKPQKIAFDNNEEVLHSKEVVEEANKGNDDIVGQDDDDKMVNDEEKVDVDENNNEAVPDHRADEGENGDDDQSVSSENQQPDGQGNERDASIQAINETTPGKDAYAVENITEDGCNSPPPKQKKKVKKEKQLEPKKLTFPKKQTKEEKLNEKIQQLKRISKESISSIKEMKNKPEETKLERKKKKKREEDNSVVETKPGKRLRRKKVMQQREIENDGTWVQCGSCFKWRHLLDIQDPSLIPDKWTCDMNSNKAYNSCDKAEESYDESEHIYTQFTEGSVVWAKMAGFPWWPAMVEIDPDLQSYVDMDPRNPMTPTHYHTVFFDDHVSRAWVRASFLKKFTGDPQADGIFQITGKTNKYSKEIAAAKKNALNALKCDIQERIKQFGFAARFKGPWANPQKEVATTSTDFKAVKKRKSHIKQTKDDENNDEEMFLDETTMDDVINSTESLLDNVESLLDSLDSDLDVSDADSPEIIPVKKQRKLNSTESTLDEEDMEDDKDDLAVAMDYTKTNDADDFDAIDDAKNESTDENEKLESGGHTYEPNLKKGETGSKLDTEIFSFEMWDDKKENKNETSVKKVTKQSNKSSREDTTAENCKKEPKVKNESKLPEKKVLSAARKDNKKAKENKKKVKDNYKKVKEDNKSKWEKQEQDAFDVVYAVEKETSSYKLENEEVTNTDCNELEMNLDNTEITDKEDNEVNGLENKKEQYSEDAEVLELILEDEINKDVGKNVNDEVSDNTDNASLVPDMCANGTADKYSGKAQNSQRMDEEEEDFDLGEQSMYDTRNEVVEKVAIPLVTVLPHNMIDPGEESDPFDLMEE